jgi:hypothetical protein
MYFEALGETLKLGPFFKVKKKKKIKVNFFK